MYSDERTSIVWKRYLRYSFSKDIISEELWPGAEVPGFSGREIAL